MLIRLIIFLVIFYVIYRVIKNILIGKQFVLKTNQSEKAPSAGEELIQDPNCHTYVPVSQSYKKEIAGKEYHFCSKECYEKYMSGNNK